MDKEEVIGLVKHFMEDKYTDIEMTEIDGVIKITDSFYSNLCYYNIDRNEFYSYNDKYNLTHDTLLTSEFQGILRKHLISNLNL